ncbi:maleate cis-trans isomerase family protein [Roseomonas fluvialis]|uniref:Asp/Glu/hydantoin racemase n=1 Tax=Roseomonas fluvialis TaxID=1750527 RepID=A0ABM7XYB8_9PROT|nr:hypothetical protein [Roseomonas fluvialis]BDG70494.1 Asp/Glu/hydantoin racemase [Roseomonas fluvialis]
MRRAIGTILPSSNRSVERATIAILRNFEDVDASFARITYFGAGTGQPKDGYDAAAYRNAAWQLSHAEVSVLCWNGSRGATFGLASDEALCAEMTGTTGLPATTASLATATLLARLGAKRLGFVVPGDHDYAADAARGLGCELAAVRGFGQTDNLDAARVAPGDIAALAREVATAKPDAILVWSTNLPGFEVAASLETELGVPVIDSASAGVWGSLALLGIDPAPARPFGRIFAISG